MTEILTQATAFRSVTRLRPPGALCGNSSRRATIWTPSCGTFCCRIPTPNDESHRLLLQVPAQSALEWRNSCGETSNYRRETSPKEAASAMADGHKNRSSGAQRCTGEYAVGRTTISWKTCRRLCSKIRAAAHSEIRPVRQHGNRRHPGRAEGDWHQTRRRSHRSRLHVGRHRRARVVGECD